MGYFMELVKPTRGKRPPVGPKGPHSSTEARKKVCRAQNLLVYVNQNLQNLFNLNKFMAEVVHND